MQEEEGHRGPVVGVVAEEEVEGHHREEVMLVAGGRPLLPLLLQVDTKLLRSPYVHPPYYHLNVCHPFSRAVLALHPWVKAAVVAEEEEGHHHRMTDRPQEYVINSLGQQEKL